MEKKVIVVGAIGKNERKNRDSYRVILGGVYRLPYNPILKKNSLLY